MLSAVISLLLAITGIFTFVLSKDLYNHRSELIGKNVIMFSVGGFLANFFDTLGIGSFAPLTAFFKFFKLVPDRIIPGTLNVSCCIPVILEALIFMKIIDVEPITLTALLAAAVLGAVIGAGFVAKLPEKRIQLAMGFALIAVAAIIFTGIIGLTPVGGQEVGLTGIKLVIGVIGNFILGALMTIGIGLFAPCMALVYLLGLNPHVAFPIMMGSCAFLQPAASIKFIKEKAYDRKASLWIMIPGAIGVLIAAFVVKNLSLQVLQWVVLCVIIYTAIIMLKSALKK